MMNTLHGAAAYLPYARPHDVPPDAPAILQILAATYGGSLTNLHLILAYNLPLLEAQMQHLSILLGPTDELSATDRCLLVLVAARRTDCRYVEQFVRFFLRRGTPTDGGIDEQGISALLDGYVNGTLDGSRREICRFAERVAANPRAVTVEDIARLRNEGLSPQSILDIVALTAYAHYIADVIHALGIPPDLDDDAQARRLQLMRQSV